MRVGLWCFVGAVAGTAGVLAAAELLSAGGDAQLRSCIHAGGAAGGLLAVSVLPFALAVSRIRGGDAQSDARFWTWWGGGLLVRLALLGGLAFGLRAWCGAEHFQAASMTMMAVYLAAMFAEVGWLATVLAKSDRKATEGKA
jgi:hypothetical protein